MTRVGDRTLRASILALLALTLLSFGASYLHLPSPWEMVVALAIAGAKITIVALYFMRLVEASKSIKLVVFLVPAFIVLFVGLVYGDVATRLPPTGAASASR